jgi:CRISPR-associated protein Cas6
VRDMYWQESEEEVRYQVPDDVVDLLFAIDCRTLPVDHAYALAEALRSHLPWLGQERGAGVHPLHVAESGNGWMRPQGPDDLLHLSRRTKLGLRVPAERVAQARSLSGETLDVAGRSMQIKEASVRNLSDLTTLFSRYVPADEGVDDEQAFLELAASRLGQLGIRPRKMLCGTERAISTPGGTIRARSLMIADLSVEQSVRLQEEGIGPHRELGCGLFVPHKDIKEVGKAASAAQ